MCRENDSLVGNESTNVDDAVPLGKKVQFSDLVGGQCLLQMIKINETFLSLERSSLCYIIILCCFSGMENVLVCD